MNKVEVKIGERQRNPLHAAFLLPFVVGIVERTYAKNTDGQMWTS